MAEKKFAVILSGNGVYDGAEIHESVMSLYAIQLNNCSYEIFAPNIKQHHVVNHISGEQMNEERNVLIESARIARGSIKDLSEFDQAKNFEVIVTSQKDVWHKCLRGKIGEADFRNRVLKIEKEG